MRTLFALLVITICGSALAQETVVGKAHKFCDENTKQLSEFVDCILLIRNSPETKNVVSGNSDFMLFSDKAMSLGELVKRGVATEGEARYQLRLLSVESESRAAQSSAALADCRRRRSNWQMAFNQRLVELSSRPGAMAFQGMAQADRETTMVYGPIPKCQ